MTDKSVWLIDDLREGEVADIHGKRYPLVGGRIRLLREHFPAAELTTEVLEDDPDRAVVRARVHDAASGRGSSGIGTASLPADQRLKDSLVELAETRAVARALRWFGLGVDATGAEEVQDRNVAGPGRGGHRPPPKETMRTLLRRAKEAGVDLADLEPATNAEEREALRRELERRLDAAGGQRA